jgi:hypothetical protein
MTPYYIRQPITTTPIPLTADTIMLCIKMSISNSRLSTTFPQKNVSVPLLSWSVFPSSPQRSDGDVLQISWVVANIYWISRRGKQTRVAPSTFHVGLVISIHNIKEYVRSEFFMAVTLKNAVFWVITQCGSRKNRCFSGTCRLHHCNDENRRARKSVIKS